MRVPDPGILNPRDAIIKANLTAVCGSRTPDPGSRLDQISLFTTAARSVSTVAIDGAHFETLSAPRFRRSPSAPFGAGSSRLTTIMARATAAEATLFATIAIFAGTVI